MVELGLLPEDTIMEEVAAAEHWFGFAAGHTPHPWLAVVQQICVSRNCELVELSNC